MLNLFRVFNFHISLHLDEGFRGNPPPNFDDLAVDGSYTFPPMPCPLPSKLYISNATEQLKLHPFRGHWTVPYFFQHVQTRRESHARRMVRHRLARV